MVDKDVLIAKVNSIQRCLKRIQEVTDLDPNTLENLDTREIFILNLQRAIQSSIDLAAHVIADEGLGVPNELREHFDLLEQAGVIKSEQSKKLRKMVGFRNIAVHEYQAIDIDILKSILKHHLKDIENYYVAVLDYYDIN
ncbi:MAG: DUF86 domain-containing protein [Balneolaceae bacterium]|nr:DUF86 domain-containing protein [Balneolaceae bacterium]